LQHKIKSQLEVIERKKNLWKSRTGDDWAQTRVDKVLFLLAVVAFCLLSFLSCILLQHFFKRLALGLKGLTSQIC